MPPLLCDPLQPAHVRPESLWNFDRPIGLLVVLDNRQPRAPHSQAPAVDGVNKLDFTLRAARPVADIGPPRLKAFEVRAGGNLPVELLSRQPDLQVKRFGRGEARVARAQ